MPLLNLFIYEFASNFIAGNSLMSPAFAALSLRINKFTNYVPAERFTGTWNCKRNDEENILFSFSHTSFLLFATLLCLFFNILDCWDYSLRCFSHLVFGGSCYKFSGNVVNGALHVKNIGGEKSGFSYGTILLVIKFKQLLRKSHIFFMQ